MRFLADLLGHDMQRPGASTGTNLYGCLQLISEAMAAGTPGGSIVTLLCDNGNRYGDTYYNDAWLEHKGFDMQLVQAYYDQVSHFWDTGDMKHVCLGVVSALPSLWKASRDVRSDADVGSEFVHEHVHNDPTCGY